MKPLLFLACLLPLCLFAQRLVLIDRQLVQPVQLKDSISLEEVSQGAYPLYASDIDALVNGVEWIARRIANGADMPQNMDTAFSAHCMLTIRRHENQLQDNFQATLQVSVDNMKLPLELTRNERRRNTAKRLIRFADYLRNNRVLVGGVAAGK